MLLCTMSGGSAKVAQMYCVSTLKIFLYYVSTMVKSNPGLSSRHCKIALARLFISSLICFMHSAEKEVLEWYMLHCSRLLKDNWQLVKRHGVI